MRASTAPSTFTAQPKIQPPLTAAQEQRMEEPHRKPRPRTLTTRLICSSCIGEGYLRDEVNARGARAVCSYCEKHLPTITLGEMVARLDAVFDEHYMLIYMGNLSEEDCAILNEVQARFGWDTKRTRPTEIICSLANIPAEPAEHLRLTIDAYRRADDERGPSSLAEDDEYARIAPANRKLNELWDRCERSFTTEVRHFNRRVESYARLLSEAGLTLGVCDWGYCVYREEYSACLGNPYGPDPARREPSTCARCKNFAVSIHHRAYWIDQMCRHEALLNEPALPTQTLKIARVRFEEARAMVHSIESAVKEKPNG
jgi:hypothetical protein